MPPCHSGTCLAVAVAWTLWRLTARWALVPQLRTASLYGIGSVAAYWSWSRIAAIFA